MDIIINNPFRILGTFSNASAKDIIANVSKAKAYLKVGKSIAFESDLPTLLPTIERTNETIERALAMINQTNDRLLYGLFWFIKDSPVDEIAIGHLAAGKFSSISASTPRLRSEEYVAFFSNISFDFWTFPAAK